MGQFAGKNYVVAQALSASTDFLGPWIPLTDLDGISIQAKWTSSSLIGILKVQTTNDTSFPAQDYPDSEYAVNGAANWVWDISNLHAAFCRLVYIHTSGTGVLDANYVAKGPRNGPQGWGPTS